MRQGFTEEADNEAIYKKLKDRFEYAENDFHKLCV